MLFDLVGVGDSLSYDSRMMDLLVFIALLVYVVAISSLFRLFIGGYIGDDFKAFGSIAVATVVTSLLELLVGTGTTMVMFLGWLVSLLLMWCCNLHHCSLGVRWDYDCSSWVLVLESRHLRCKIRCLR